MPSYEKAPIKWPDNVTFKTEADAMTYRRIPDTSYYRYAGDDSAHTFPPRHFLTIDPSWLASDGRIVIVQPSEEEIEANGELREAFQFVVL